MTNAIEMTYLAAEKRLKGDYPCDSEERRLIIWAFPQLYGIAHSLYPKEFPDRRKEAK